MRALFIILITLVIVVSFAIVFGVALGVGWILTLFLPFSLFEATLLGMITTTIMWALWRNILRPIRDFGSYYDEEDDDDDEPEFEDLDEISPSRFYRTDTDRTWENWFRYVIANTIYEDILDSPGWIGQMKEGQLQEMSIRLADAAVAALKRKSPRTKRLRMTKEMLKHEMTQMGQQPYDDDILDTAVSAINDELIASQEELREVIREKSWDDPVDIF